MAAKWQQWMPLYIDRFMGSMDVQMMEPPAFKAYVRLLLCAWQSDDCTVSSDPDELAAYSGIGKRLWSKYGSSVTRKFVTVNVTVGDTVTVRLRNLVEFELWSEAKRIHEARKNAATETNATRRPKRSPLERKEQSAQRSPQRSQVHNNSPLQEQEQEQGTGGENGADAPTPTATVTVPDLPDFDADPVENIPEGLSLVQYRQFACEALETAASYANQVAMQDAIEAIAKHENLTAAEATRELIHRGREHPPEKGNWRWWVNDGGWKKAEVVGVSTEGWE